MATMRDVAKKAGVSVATVSCALSGAKNVAPETMKKIQDAINALHYIPNYAARSLKTPSSKEIGVLLMDIDDSFHADILKGITITTQKHHYNLNIAFSNQVRDLERTRIDNFISKNISGLILMTCQRECSSFFQQKLLSRNIPTVFLEQRPLDLNVNFAGFNNYKIIFQITQRLIQLGHKNISLVCGPEEYSSEMDCIQGFKDAFTGHSEVNSSIYYTTMTKESAFKTTMYTYHTYFPDAVIATSSTIAKGILETAHIFNINVPDDSVIVALGEESWNHSNFLGNVITTERSAITLGSKAAELLIQNIETPSFFEKKAIIIDDTFSTDKILCKYHPKPVPVKVTPRDELHINVVDLDTIFALIPLTKKFTQETGIQVHFDITSKTTVPLKECLQKENIEKTCLYDMYMFDNPWIYDIGSHNLLADITDFIRESKISTERFIPDNLRTCMYNNRFYGIPLLGGSQILFYRRDYFENPTIRQSFKKKYNISLRAPRTWTEFNGINRFFTRQFNPDSPTQYGTSIPMQLPEEFICLLLPCMWSHGGNLFDSETHPCINSLQNSQAFSSMLQTLSYTDGNYMNTSYNDTTQTFIEGKTAMLINFTEYVSSFNLAHELDGKIGYAMIPGRSPILPGWNLGVSNFTKKKESIYEFLRWICRQDINSYLTILDGQSTILEPYENEELKRLYPWLNLTTNSLKYARRRTPPLMAGCKIVPQIEIESIVTDAFYQTCNAPDKMNLFLQEAQERLTELLRKYRYI